MNGSVTAWRIPVIGRCDRLRDKENGFIVNLIFKDTSTVLNRAFPSIIAKVIGEYMHEDFGWQALYHVIMTSDIPNESANQREQLNVGCMDMSGNCSAKYGYS